MTKSAQWRKNFDYGDGLYSNLDKYDSVNKFLARRRKNRKKIMDRILNTRPERQCEVEHKHKSE